MRNAPGHPASTPPHRPGARWLLTGLLACSGVACGSEEAAHPGTPAAPPHEWPTYAGSAARTFFAEDPLITKANAGSLGIAWEFPTGAVLTASPVIARLELPEGETPVVFFQSWDGYLYAATLVDGRELWRFRASEQPGAQYPATGSAHVEELDGERRLFFATGETLYCLDPVTGAEEWRFHAGTGCGWPDSEPGVCSFEGERNEIESSPIVADGKVLFGMDVNDEELGKGGFYAVDARTGTLAWYFDLTSGTTCTPAPGDALTRFDGYHTEDELGLPTGFFGSRPGCDFPREANGCSNVWSSAAVDHERGLIFTASGNCDVDNDPTTPRPPPPGPDHEDAVLALRFDGTSAWRWRPRQLCADGTDACYNLDLEFGGVPNLFSIAVPGQGTVDVVGVGDKSGTYYVLDREGVNRASGVRHDDADARGLPYWTTNVVPGGASGGIIATAAVDEAAGRIYFSTASGDNPLQPQRPTVHALEAATGAIVWQNVTEDRAEASFAPTSASPGLVYAGSMTGSLRIYDSASGDRLVAVPVSSSPVASGIVVFEGMVLVGGGIGQRGPDPTDPADVFWRRASKLTALCVPGTEGCSL